MEDYYIKERRGKHHLTITSSKAVLTLRGYQEKVMVFRFKDFKADMNTKERTITFGGEYDIL